MGNNVRSEDGGVAAMSTVAAGDPDAELIPDVVAILGITRFYLAHITAGICLLISVAVSGTLTTYILLVSRNLFFKQPIGDRLTVYLSTCDFCFGVSHLANHLYLLVLREEPHNALCAFFGAFIVGFYTAQVCIVTFIAANSFFMVVKQVKIDLGVHDWKIIIFLFGVPAFYCALSPFHIFGPSGHGLWCAFNSGHTAGVYLGFTLTMLGTVFFLVSFVCYVCVWLKLQRVARAQNHNLASKYNHVVKVFMAFVSAFMIQAIPIAVYCIMDLFMTPPFLLLWLVTSFTNLGGLLNFLAYTYVRRRLQRTGKGFVQAGISSIASLEMKKQQQQQQHPGDWEGKADQPLFHAGSDCIQVPAGQLFDLKKQLGTQLTNGTSVNTVKPVLCGH